MLICSTLWSSECWTSMLLRYFSLLTDWSSSLAVRSRSRSPTKMTTLHPCHGRRLLSPFIFVLDEAKRRRCRASMSFFLIFYIYVCVFLLHKYANFFIKTLLIVCRPAAGRGRRRGTTALHPADRHL